MIGESFGLALLAFVGIIIITAGISDVAQTILNALDKNSKSGKDDEEKDVRNEIGMEENSWVRAYTNPMEHGVRDFWAYECGYCGIRTVGAGIIDNENHCAQCGALLVEDNYDA